MDIYYFLKERTGFISYFHKNATKPFSEIIHAIENEIEPFIPPYSEDSEPPFIKEWSEANTGVETIGHSCISMLSSALHLFLKEWVGRLERNHGMKFEVNWKNAGWFNGYIEILKSLEISMPDCPANLEIIEQVTLARNRVQHPEEITDLRIRHNKSYLKRFPSPFFAREEEMSFAKLNDSDGIYWLIEPSISATQEKLLEAIENVEIFCCWLEEDYWKSRKA